MPKLIEGHLDRMVDQLDRIAERIRTQKVEAVVRGDADDASDLGVLWGSVVTARAAVMDASATACGFEPEWKVRANA